MARANTYASSAPDVYFYPYRKWHGALAGVSYTFLKDVVSQIDARNSIYYIGRRELPGDDGRERRTRLQAPHDMPLLVDQTPAASTKSTLAILILLKNH